MEGTVIIHSGIKGQKWGQRNGPPYPLRNADRSPSEKKKNKESASSKALKASKKATRIANDAKVVVKVATDGAMAVSNPNLDKYNKVAAIANGAKSLSDVAANAAGEAYDAKHRKHYDTSKYTNDELQTKVNRLRNEQIYENKTGRKMDPKLSDREAMEAVRRINLDEQYNNLKNDDVRRGRERTENIIRTIGGVASATAAAATTAYMIKKFIGTFK